MTHLLAAGDGHPTEILRLVLGSMIWAEIVGVTVAWLKLRRSAARSNRSSKRDRLKALAHYVERTTGMVGIWATVILVGALLGMVVS